MRLLYILILYLFGVPYAVFRLYFSGYKEPAYRQRWQERFGCFKWDKPKKSVIWVHAVSVGEVNAVKTLLSRLLKDYPAYQVLVTTMTPSGAETLERHFYGKIKHLYIPYDIPCATRRFIRLVKPDVLLVVETEIWPNLYHTCHSNNIPVLMLNARLSEQSFKKYNRVKRIFPIKQTLKKVSIIAVQTSRDAERFIALGADKTRVHVKGNLKFDFECDSQVIEDAVGLKQDCFGSRPVWIAASTHRGEEEAILKAHQTLLKYHSGTILILAPRHPKRVSEVVALCEARKLAFIKRTENKRLSSTQSVYILDTLNELILHYAASQIAFVGGSLVKKGGQNMIEPASLGMPIISGPSTYNFAEVTQLLLEHDALSIISNADELSEKVCSMFNNGSYRNIMGGKSREAMKKNKGNVESVIEIIKPYINSNN